MRRPYLASDSLDLDIAADRMATPVIAAMGLTSTPTYHGSLSVRGLSLLLGTEFHSEGNEEEEGTHAVVNAFANASLAKLEWVELSPELSFSYFWEFGPVSTTAATTVRTGPAALEPHTQPQLRMFVRRLAPGAGADGVGAGFGWFGVGAGASMRVRVRALPAASGRSLPSALSLCVSLCITVYSCV